MARQAVRTALKHVLWFCAYGVLGVVLTLLVVFVLHLEGRPDLDAWHRAELDEEFTAGSRVSNFEEYLALEDRLFAQLDERVYDHTGPAGEDRVNRYKRGSLSDPQRWTPDWNRSFEMPVDAPRASVLLLHGLSDSPYSLRALGERLHAEGAHVLGLRIPGHGTAPSGLVTVRWQDMAAAVRLAVAHLAERNPGRPLHVVGYSNGAALAVQYALAAIDDPALPRVDRLVLLSPEIGVAAAAALAVWQARLGYLLGLDKLAWNDILPEYDPFKYGSFAVNAGDVSHRLTAEIQRRIDQLAEGGKLGAIPSILAFSSAVDATVLAPALVANLFDRLPPGPHELVLFDINHVIGIEPLLSWSPDEMVRVLRRNAGRGFAFSLVTNADAHSREVIERRWRPGSDLPVETPLGLQWPADVYSLSHVALPFPPDDPVYGGRPHPPSPGVHLGDIAWRGERGVLQVSAAAMLRLRWNPFYSYQERRVLEFLSLAEPTAGGRARPE
ncbi:MAG: alpha/beta fold hydrolase [Lysobacterales bacterium]|nr:MAG: alpha/beta fold hydrolase [Xanthomonadales bacterium]